MLDYGTNTPGDKNEVVNFTPANAVFVVNHNLNKFPGGLTIYGRWTSVTRTSADSDGGMICYFGE